MILKWFPDNERAIATTVVTMSLVLGSIIGVALGPIFVYDSDKVNQELGKVHC